MPGEAVSSPLKALERVAESKLEVSLGAGETRKLFPMIMLYCCDISKAKNLSAA